LFFNGADPFKKGRIGKSALDVAIESRNETAILLIQNHLEHISKHQKEADP
jgi:hypothetical protein